MGSRNMGRLMAVGGCVALVAALQLGEPPDGSATPHRHGAAGTEAAPGAAPIAAAVAVVRVAGAPSTTQAQPISLDIDLATRAARDGQLRVALADGSSYVVRLQRQETDRFGAWTLVGHVRTKIGRQAAVLTFGSGAVFGTLPMPDGRSLQLATQHGDVVATLAAGMTPLGDLPAASDIAAMPVSRGDLRPLVPMLERSSVRSSPVIPAAPALPVPRARATGAAQPSLATTTSSSLVTITILGTYADDLVALRGSEAAVKVELSHMVAAANQSHIDSGSRVRLQLAGTHKLAIPTTWSNTDALYAMTVAPVDGVDTEILRNTYSADLVTFVRPFVNHENCGIAWIGGSGLNGTDTDSLYAYSVVNREPCGPHVLAHETGHNLGAAHDRETASDNPEGELYFGAFNDSFGWRGWSGREFADIMSYNTRGEPWLGVFSSPQVKACNGKPCGVAGVADVVSTFGRMAQTVSEFRRTNGKGSVSDARVQTWVGAHQKLRFPVRLSVQRNTVAAVDVSVVSGAEFVLLDTYPQRIEFAPFLQQADFEVEVLGCCNLPNGRQVTVKLSNPVGFMLEDDTAVGTITDIQAEQVRGDLLPQLGWPGQIFEEQVFLQTSGASGPRFASDDMTLQSPYSFLFDVVPGSNVLVEGSTYFKDWRAIPTLLPEVRSTLDDIRIPLVHAVQVDGKIMLPPELGGWTLPPTADFRPRFREIYKGRVLSDELIQASGFRRHVLPGATVEIIVDVSPSESSGVRPYLYRRFDVQEPLTLELVTGTMDSAFIVGGRPLREGYPGERRTLPIGVQLTGPAPSGGATVYWYTRDGTATAGSDYVAGSGALQFTAGETFKQVGIVILGDGAPEPDEYFEVGLTMAQNVGLNASRTRVDVLRDEPGTGGPGQKTVVTSPELR